mmetsp:Transcript_19150/g.44621  ORF Transcript_19150/g.44621 Transcript_19150/m.44621 type:complete len:241 (-) Transcript_19150:650-1372(-)
MVFPASWCHSIQSTITTTTTFVIIVFGITIFFYWSWTIRCIISWHILFGYRFRYGIPIEIKFDSILVPVGQFGGEVTAFPNGLDEFHGPWISHDGTSHDDTIVTRRDVFLHILDRFDPTRRQGDDRSTGSGKHPTQFQCLILVERSRHSITIGNQYILGHAFQCRIDFTGRMAFDNGLQSHSRGEIQEIFEGWSQYRCHENNCIGTGIFGHSQLNLIDNDILHDDGRCIGHSTNGFHGRA